MKIAIVYKSLSGNTKTVAEAINKALKNHNVVYFGEPENTVAADLYLIGSWTDKGMCAKEIAQFVQNLKGKKIAYFGTAGFGGSEQYYQTLYQRVSELVDDSNELLGYFFCQGKMPLGVRDRYVKMLQEHPDDKKLQVSIENFDQALSHPDEKDLSDAKTWITDLIAKQ